MACFTEKKRPYYEITSNKIEAFTAPKAVKVTFGRSNLP